MTLLSLLFFVIVARAAGLPNRRSTDYTVCENEACREVGEAIRRNMNHSHKPCTNFYKYGCGLWPENNSIPANDVQWSERHVLDLKTSNRLKEVLEEQSEYDNLPPIKMVKQYYRSCMDEDAIEKHGLEPIQKLLDAKGGWPIQLGNQKSNNYTWQEVDNYYLQMFYISSFIDIGCTSKDEDATKFILTVEVQTKSFFDSTIVKRSVHQFDVWERNRLDKVLNAFKRHIGINVSSVDYFADMTDLLNFSRDLRNIGQYEEIIQKETGKVRDIMTIAELQEYYDLAETQQSTARARINWLQMIQLLFKSSNINIDASTPVMVYNKYRLHKLVHLLDVTSTHVIVNYIHWNIVNQFLPYLTKEMRDIEFETTDTEYNMTEQKPRWKTCIEDIALEEALSFLFIKKYNSKNMTTALTEMLDDIKAEIKKRILNSTWTSASAKDFMIDKMDNTISLIGYPSWYNNQTALIERYEGLEVGENYFKNKVAATVYEIRREIKDYHKSLNRTVWRVAPISLNAYYTPPMNLIILAAQVQDPYFAPGIPLAINYGAIGTIIGHKLAHIFNTTETSQAFEERIKCFVDQYNNYTLVERSENKTPFQLDEILTKDENIADNIGLETAFAAFQKRKLTAGPQAKLPELTDISDEQLFFLSFANSWCEAIAEQYKISSANTGDHSLSEFRILGTLGNMESFSDAFDCPVGSPMNRGSKCTLWN